MRLRELVGRHMPEIAMTLTAVIGVAAVIWAVTERGKLDKREERLLAACAQVEGEARCECVVGAVLKGVSSRHEAVKLAMGRYCQPLEGGR